MSQRLGLINTYSTYNLGDAAIYAALAALIRGPDQPALLEGSPPSSPQEPWQIVATVQDDPPNPVAGVEFQPALGPCTAYVSVGGDIFNNSREWLITKQFLLNLRDLRRHPHRTLLFGQSLPRSCHGLSFALLVRSLRRLAAVCVRDAESHRRLQEAGLPCALSYDTAFALSPDPRWALQAERILREQGVDPAAAALLSVRAFDSMYGHDNAHFLERMVELCRGLERRGLRPVILVQSQAYAADNDLAVAEAIVAAVPAVSVFNPFAAAADLQQWQLAMGALACSALAIGIRYHTTVLALAAGRLPYNLHYSNKGRDLSQRLALPGCDLASFDPLACLDTIVACAARRFDAAPIRTHVQQSFHRCLQAALAGSR